MLGNESHGPERRHSNPLEAQEDFQRGIINKRPSHRVTDPPLSHRMNELTSFIQPDDGFSETEPACEAWPSPRKIRGVYFSYRTSPLPEGTRGTLRGSRGLMNNSKGRDEQSITLRRTASAGHGNRNFPQRLTGTKGTSILAFVQ